MKDIILAMDYLYIKFNIGHRDIKPHNLIVNHAKEVQFIDFETADLILVKSDPKNVVTAIRYAKATYRKMQQNLLWATGYNIIAIPLAAGVLYGAGVLISPAIGGVFMSLSTIIVAVNAKLLNVKK